MKILVSAHFFPPDVGGIPEVASILVREFLAAGHAVRVVTTTGRRADEEPCEVLRAPGAGALWRAVRWCDAALHVQIGLRSAWPLVFVRRPWVVSHHAHLRRGSGALGFGDVLKRAVLGSATNIAVSSALAATLPVPCAVVGNPYREEVFFPDATVARERDVLFVGRMTPDKGADVLAAALGELKRRGRAVAATFLGDGPEMGRVKAGAPDALFLPGTGDREAVAAIMRAHRVVVVPSRGAEPFGLTAVEGLACGCGVVGSAGGGLAEAMGPFGVTFPEEDAVALADAVERALERGAPDAGEVAAHLAQFRPSAVAARYLEALERAAG